MPHSTDTSGRAWLSWPRSSPGRICIVGDGLAGACLARQLAEQGHAVRVLGDGAGSSHRIPALLLRDYAEKAASPSHRLYAAAFAQAQRFYARHCPDSHLSLELNGPDGARPAGRLLGREAIAALLIHPLIDYQSGQVDTLAAQPDGGWVLHRGDAQEDAQILVLCTALAPAGLIEGLPLSPVAGQVIQCEVHLSQGFARTVHGLPMPHGCQIGSSYRPSDTDGHVHAEDSQSLLQQARKECAELGPTARLLSSQAGVRSSSPDHLPLIGPAPDFQRWTELQRRHERQRNPALRPAAPVLPNLWLNLGHGSRGATMAPLAAALLAAAITGHSPPLPSDLLAAIHPGRFASRDVRRGRFSPPAKG